MLLQLKVENYALIKELNLDFSKGFTCITGETGAGKSILVGALSLLLGERADKNVLFDKQRKCIVEAVFQISHYGLNEFFDENNLDYDDEVICRREVSDNGKSRAFINDTPVSLNMMKELGDKLVDIHSQNKTITLNDSSFQLSVVDDYVGQQVLLKDYRRLFYSYRKDLKELEELIEKDLKAKTEKDYLQFLYEELSAADIKAGEMENMENFLEMMNHAELIKTNLQTSSFIMAEKESNLLSLLYEIKNLISQISSFHPSIHEMLDRIEQVYIEVKDINAEISGLEENANYDPEQKEAQQARIDHLNRLLVKHHVLTDEELLRVKNELGVRLSEFDNLEDKIKMLIKQTSIQLEELKNAAAQLSRNRSEAIPEIEKKIILILKNLGMPQAKVSILLTTGELNESGFDKVVLLFNANKGGELRELAKVASGGELSRLMLSIKSLISTRNLLPTLILDEIDSGISGETASKAATIMKDMSAHMQVIAITHLPQIAGKAEVHIRASKETDEQQSVSVIRTIHGDERVMEIAKMLSNENVSASAIQTARELLTDMN